MAEKEAPGDKGAAAAGGAAAGGGGMSAWMPVIAVVVLVPVLSYGMAMFVIAPQLEKRFAAAAAAAPAANGAHGAPAEAGAHGKPGGEKAAPTVSYEFKDIVSNLAGSMRSRYIKVSFTAYSAKADFPAIAETNRAKLLDATIGVLARLSLADLEDPAAKSKVSNEIIYAMEAVLQERVVEQIFFSEFVIQ